MAVQRCNLAMSPRSTAAHTDTKLQHPIKVFAISVSVKYIKKQWELQYTLKYMSWESIMDNGSDQTCYLKESAVLMYQNFLIKNSVLW